MGSKQRMENHCFKQIHVHCIQLGFFQVSFLSIFFGQASSFSRMSLSCLKCGILNLRANQVRVHRDYYSETIIILGMKLTATE